MLARVAKCWSTVTAEDRTVSSGWGDQLDLSLAGNRRRRLLVASLGDTHVPKAMARTMYEDVTPPPTQEEQELRDLLRRAGPRPPANRGAPDKRDRRTLRRLKRG